MTATRTRPGAVVRRGNCPLHANKTDKNKLTAPAGPYPRGEARTKATFDDLPVDLQVKILKDVVDVQQKDARSLRRQKTTLMVNAQAESLFFVNIPLKMASDVCVICHKWQPPSERVRYTIRKSGSCEKAAMMICSTCSSQPPHRHKFNPPNKAAVVIDSQVWNVQSKNSWATS